MLFGVVPAGSCSLGWYQLGHALWGGTSLASLGATSSSSSAPAAGCRGDAVRAPDVMHTIALLWAGPCPCRVGAPVPWPDLAVVQSCGTGDTLGRSLLSEY
jgi:hypothetical protein